MTEWQDSADLVIHDLSAKQQKALAALLTTTSVRDAAKEAGVSERSLYRWLSEDDSFRQAYRLRRRAALDSLIGLLQSTGFKAIEVLSRALNSGNENVRVRSALGVLEHTIKAYELDISDRLERLEKLAEAEGASSGW